MLRWGTVWLVIAAGTLGVFLLVVFLVLVLLSDGDIAAAYPSPQVHRGVRELDLTHPSTSRWSPRHPADFDGDGIADRLSVEYFHMEPLFARTTSGMVYVRSGSTGAVLLAHAVTCPLNPANWSGDVDGNGTEDVRIEDEGRTFALGFVGRD